MQTPDPAASIAIIGLSGRFPGAATPYALWRRLLHGDVAVERFDAATLDAAGVPAAVRAHPGFVGAGAVLRGIEDFDADFFGIPRREAALIDPQQRVFLECAWEALEDAGYPPAGSGESVRIGVFGGVGAGGYLEHHLWPQQGALLDGRTAILLANEKDFLATRVGYRLGLVGPCVTVQAACSTSLLAVHTACTSLLNGECEIAVAGGISIQIPQGEGYVPGAGDILSPSGSCRPFDPRADGTIRGDGAALVVLRRLADALEAGDTIRAVILGSAVNNDGAAKVGFTAPSEHGQAAVIAEAMAVAGVEPGTVRYVETHGTGTAMGDPVELRGLARAFADVPTASVSLGALKGNIGHLDAAAGAAGLLKAAFVVSHDLVPPNPWLDAPNPAALRGTPFRMDPDARTLPPSDTPTRAGVSAFGIGGTNMHVVLEAPPKAPASAAPREQRPWIVPLSARSERGLAELQERLRAHLELLPETPLSDLAFTLQEGRRSFPWRRAVVAADVAGLLAGLGPTRHARPDRPVVFLFSGQGAQRPGMAAGLYAADADFRAELDQCASFARRSGVDLLGALFATDADAGQRLARTELAQPALFALDVALARWLEKRGVRARSAIGHSIGELTAACVSGVFSVEDGMRLACARGRLVQACEPGVLLSVAMSAERLEPRLSPTLTLSVINGRELCVVGGPADAIAELEARLAGEVRTTRLRTSHAFHTPAVEGAMAPFAAAIAEVKRSPPQRPYLSNVTGRWVTAEDAVSPAAWARHLRAPVRFADALDQLAPDQPILLELGPGRTLSRLAELHGLDAVPALGDVNGGAHTYAELLAALWEQGVAVEWSAARSGPGRRIPLPTTPFERVRCWIDRPDRGPALPHSLSETLRPNPDIPDSTPTPKRSLASRPGPARRG